MHVTIQGNATQGTAPPRGGPPLEQRPRGDREAACIHSQVSNILLSNLPEVVD